MARWMAATAAGSKFPFYLPLSGGGDGDASATSQFFTIKNGRDFPGRFFCAPYSAQARSNRSAFITLLHAATKSFTNFSFASAQA